jgi:hypothetical protein
MQKLMYAVATTLASVVLSALFWVIASLTAMVAGPVAGIVAVVSTTIGLNYFLQTQKGEQICVSLISAVKYQIDQFVVWYYTRNEEQPA